MEYNEIIIKIASYVLYEQNWDGYDGVPASLDTAKDAIVFINNLPNDCYGFEVGLAGDGEISLSICYGRAYVDIGFRGDKTYSYFIRNNDGKEFLGNNVDVNIPLDEEVLSVLRSYPANVKNKTIGWVIYWPNAKPDNQFIVDHLTRLSTDNEVYDSQARAETAVIEYLHPSSDCNIKTAQFEFTARRIDN